ncbi:MAG: ATP-binding protein [Eudoraea sp.]|uniref:ATP-binding protein n=1 Tax=Eudoraea sp. TaxID=1979955 RepID=UPI00326723A9
MTKSKIAISLCLFIINTIVAQNQPIVDSLKTIINLQKQDTIQVNALAYLAYEQTQLDSTIKYARQGLRLAQKLNYKKGEADCFFVMGRSNGDFNWNIKQRLTALSIYEDIRNNTGIAFSHLSLQGAYREALDYQNALKHGIVGEQIAEANNVKGVFVFAGHRLAPLFSAEISQTYLLMNKLDSALLYAHKSIDQNELFNGSKWGFPFYLLAIIETRQQNYTSALQNFRSSISLSIRNGFPHDTLQIYSGMSTLFNKTEQLDSAIFYAQKVSRSGYNQTELKNMAEALTNLAHGYKLKGNKDSLLKYMELSHNFKDSIYSKAKNQELQNITFNDQLKRQEIKETQLKYKSKVQLFALALGLFVVVLIAGILWRNNLHRKKAYALLQTQKQETDLQKVKVEQAFDELKSTQAQLIQSEKMASLGELTAGIAHEIKNPLNFVNNFSEVSNELIVEMNEEIEKGDLKEAKAIADDIKQNLEKINHHGKRADSIVKGMLQHSRSSSGVKEPTDINALCDEYLRLAYHGLRAKDKSFNAKFETTFEEGIGKVNVIPQDIGRVILNLITNAFYVVTERNKLEQKGYEPKVTVSTKKENDKVIVTVQDNGNGIPDSVKKKIFQPFFTTKPVGQGTGLGLSMSYDIVTKGHGGVLKAASKEREGTTFTVVLPITKENKKPKK